MNRAILLLLSGIGVMACDIKEEPAEENTPPTAPSVSLSPELPSGGDDIVVVIDTEATDADGDKITYSYTWLINEAVVPDVTGDTMSAAMTAKGDQVGVEVVASDGEDDSEVAVAGVFVQNTPPTIEVAFGTDEVRTNDVLTVSVTAADADDDPVDVTWDWLVNDTVVQTDGDELDGATWFEKGDVVAVEVSGSDSDGETASGSVEIVVANTAPTAPGVALSPGEPVVQNDLVCLISETPEDPDLADTFSYTFSWTVEGVAFSKATQTSWPGDTVPGEYLIADEEWICTATASDGTEDSAASTASGIVLPWTGPRTFTTCGSLGATGPFQKDCDLEYAKSDLDGEATVKAGYQAWEVPITGDYTIEAAGAQGASGTTSYVGGLGATVSGTFALTSGTVLYIAVGQMGLGQSSSSNGGGGGASWVVQDGDIPLLIAAGGGGTRTDAAQDGCDGVAGEYAILGAIASTSSCTLKTDDLGDGGAIISSSWGSAGAGFNTDGAGDPTYGAASGSWFSGLEGGQSTYSCGFAADGGFGGGGSGNGCYGGGGGGGYSGGDGGWMAGGGGSYNDGADAVGTDGANSGDGYVIIDLVL